MKILRVAVGNFQSDAPWSLKEQKTAITIYERRLVRCWRVGMLPHEIAKIVGLTTSGLCTKLESLQKQGVVMTADTRREPDYLKYAGITDKKTRIKPSAFNTMCSDYEFYLKHEIKRSIIALLLECPQHYIGHITNKLKSSLTPKSPPDLASRNKDLVAAFELRKSERGIKTSLAKEFDMHRKNIDLILIAANIDPKVTKPKPRGESELITKRNKDFINKYEAGLVDGKKPRGLISRLSNEFGFTHAYCYKLLEKLYKQ